MRASDADRDRVAERLREALAEGRLTAEEHAERLDAVYRAKTYADLAPVVEDLPAAPDDAPAIADDLPVPRAADSNVVAIVSSVDRRGRWLVEAQTNAVSVLGDLQLDLRQAVLTHREVTINAVAVLGSIRLTVPPGVRVENSAIALLGSSSTPQDGTTEPNAPVIRITGFALLGSVDVARDGTGGIEVHLLGRARGRRRERLRHRLR